MSVFRQGLRHHRGLVVVAVAEIASHGHHCVVQFRTSNAHCRQAMVTIVSCRGRHDNTQNIRSSFDSIRYRT